MREALIFKIASEPSEFEQIHQLNYETFVEEIPQHERNAERRLVDRFHAENTYFICVDGKRLVGMAAMRDQRPFSLDQKLDNLDRFLPPGRKVVEIRLLAIRPERRKGKILLGLLELMVRYGLARGYDLAVISGTTRALKMYYRIGFVPFGPLVGKPGAWYQPMYLTVEAFRKRVAPLLEQARERKGAPGPSCRGMSYDAGSTGGLITKERCR